MPLVKPDSESGDENDYATSSATDTTEEVMRPSDWLRKMQSGLNPRGSQSSLTQAPSLPEIQEEVRPEPEPTSTYEKIVGSIIAVRPPPSFTMDEMLDLEVMRRTLRGCPHVNLDNPDHLEYLRSGVMNPHLDPAAVIASIHPPPCGNEYKSEGSPSARDYFTGTSSPNAPEPSPELSQLEAELRTFVNTKMTSTRDFLSQADLSLEAASGLLSQELHCEDGSEIDSKTTEIWKLCYMTYSLMQQLSGRLRNSCTLSTVHQAAEELRRLNSPEAMCGENQSALETLALAFPNLLPTEYKTPTMLQPSGGSLGPPSLLQASFGQPDSFNPEDIAVGLTTLNDL